MQIKVGTNYRLLKKISAGAFGEIYLAQHIKNGQEFAVKLQSAMAKIPQLLNEYRIYKHLLSDFQQDKGIPSVHFCGLEGDYNVMVMDLMGPSLNSLLQERQRFSVKTSLMLAQQLSRRLQFIHQKGIIHRDIKPDNFVFGIGKKAKKLYAIDFGLAKKYIVSGKHMTYAENKSLCGTARYASINNHLGVDQTRRDDFESMMYVIIHFLLGKLPWQGLKGTSKDNKYQMIKMKKMAISPAQLCKGLPLLTQKWLKKARDLRFDEKPNYVGLREECEKTMREMGVAYDEEYDWQSQKIKKLK